MVMKWLNNNKDIKVMFVVFIVFLVGMTSYTIGRVQNNDTIVTLEKSVITLQDSVNYLLDQSASIPPPSAPSLTTEQEQFMCMQNTEDYKDGFLEISTILTCMNLQLTE